MVVKHCHQAHETVNARRPGKRAAAWALVAARCRSGEFRGPLRRGNSSAQRIASSAITKTNSPIVIMFQAATQVAMAKNVSGYVNGATSDFVFYRLVKKN